MVKKILVVSNVAKRFLMTDSYDLKDGFEFVFADVSDYKKRINDVDYVIAGIERYTKPLLRNAKKLKMISRCAHGVDNIAEGIVPVTDCRGSLNRSMAEMVLGYIIMCLRDIKRIDSLCRKGTWKPVVGTTLANKTVGIIGYGNIGSELGRLLRGLGITILHNDIIRNRSNCDLERLCSNSDIISLHCDLNKASYHLIDNRMIELMKHGVILINTSRGSVIKEKHLIENIDKFKYVVLDVFEKEPLDKNSRLLSFDNIILGMHCAGATEEGWNMMGRESIDNIILWDRVHDMEYL